jgi:hypothetical protein
MGEPLRSGEGDVIADLDFSLIDSRKAKMDSAEHVMCRQVEGAECASGQRDSSMIGAMASRLCPVPRPSSRRPSTNRSVVAASRAISVGL